MTARHELPTLLFQHWVGPRELVVSRFAAPMSIRDQIVRARLLARHVVEAGVVGDRTPAGRVTGGPAKGAVVVVGAGVAGVAFAEELLRATPGCPELDVVVFERDGSVLGQQASAAHRIVDPTLYDWPAEHWTVDRYPVTDGDDFPLAYRAGTGDEVARTWRDALARNGDGRLTVVFGATVDFDRARRRRLRRRLWRRRSRPPPDRARAITSVTPWRGGPVTVSSGWTGARMEVSPGASRRRDCVLVVHALGIGKERVFLEGRAEHERYRCHEFWSEDRYVEAGARVLVAGGGDGAIQDLVRLATGCRNPKELLGALFDGAAADVLSTVGRRVAPAVDDELAMWATASEVEEVLAALRLEELMVDALNEAATIHAAAFDGARSRAQDLVGHRRITVVHRGPAYTHCYALNRLSALLLFRLLDPPRLERCTGTKLVDVRPAENVDHRCADDAKSCAAHPHSVTVEPGGDVEEAFDVVVIRHGRLAGDPGNDPLIRRVEGLIPVTGWRQVLPLRLATLGPFEGVT